MEIGIEGYDFESELMPVNQFFDLSIDFPLLGSGTGYHQFKTVKNYDDFLGRINGYETWTNTAIANMRQGIKRGLIQPRILMERKLPQLEEMLVKDIKESLFYQPIKNLPAEFSSKDKERLTKEYEKAISEKIIPSYKKLYDFIKNEYLPHTLKADGISALPGGKARYAYLVKNYTTTNKTPDEIFQIGISEVKRIKAEMEKVKAEVGFRGELKAFFDDTRTNPKLFPFETDEQVLNAYRAIDQKMQPQLAKLFNIKPKTKFEIRQVEKFRAASAAAHYQGGSPDGSRPGIFYVPIVDAKKYNIVRMESLFLHEAIPGHHYQVSLTQEQESLPKFRRFGGFSAFAEGWGLYAESLGKELGLYTDPYQYLGRLEGEMHRAIRLVVDTGIHSKGWTREEAIKYMLDNNTISEQQATAEIERYMAIPGQALSYKIGELKIWELRHKAEKELGSKFDIKEFHNEVLKDGDLPLQVLDTKINEWIASKKTSRK
jgi:uncharacterized protein (DUF885 family)